MTPADIKAFITSGKAVGTLTSQRSGEHYTYRFTAVKDAEDKFFVSLLTGPDNTRDYSYLGLLTRRDDGQLQFRTTAKSCASSGAKSVQGLQWMLAWVDRGQELSESSATFEHMGRCGKCARPLTNPESIERGLGPYCAGLL